jgi:hypothetical protein
MPPHRWKYGGALDAGHGLLGWAQLAVDGLHWLVDVDDHAFQGDRRNLKGHNHVAVDMAHSRWATVTAKTAVDLCAAELGVRYAGVDFWGNHLPTLERLNSKHLASMPKLAREWVSRVLEDPEYQLVKGARDPFAHRFHVRVASLRSAPALGHDDRSQFTLRSSAGGTYDAQTLIMVSRDFATRHVEDFISRRLRKDF